jgi:hypothetical protein
MGKVLSSVAVEVSHDLPEPTSYRGQHFIPLAVDDDMWLTYPGITYWLDPVTSAPDGACRISLIADAGFELNCTVYAETGAELTLFNANPDNLTTRSFFLLLREIPEYPAPEAPLAGTSLTFRFNYGDSRNVKDVVLPLEFDEQLGTVLSRRRLCFRLSDQPLASTRLPALDRRRPEPKTPLVYLHGYEDVDTGYETIGDRLPPIAMTRQRIGAAWRTATATGYFDPGVFPNVPGGSDHAGRAGIMQAIADLDEATVVQQLTSGGRLVVTRSETGQYTYRFLPAPEHCAPGLVLVEYYRLTSFPARYGAGRTIKTFSLLPGEQTTIRVSTYKRSTESMQQTASILDATNSETESEFSRTVNSEQSNQNNASKTFEYRAEAEAEGQATWGWGSASAKVSGGVSGSSNSAREELTKNLTNAVSQNTARASSRREVQVDTSMDVKLEQGEEQAVERTLENVNVSRTLNFVFRQMNQEYVTVLHLVDVRVAFFNGHAESRDEVPLTELDRLLGDCLRSDLISRVRPGILAELQAITDHRGRPQPDFIKTISLTGTDPSDGGGVEVDYPQVNHDFTSSYTGPDGVERTVPGIIVGTDQHVLRTDGITVDAFLGEGRALDDYSTGLQEQAVRAREIDNDRQEVETDRLRVALELVKKGDTAGVGLYQRLFPIPTIVNQIDHAAINTPSNGQVVAPPEPATADAES